MDCSNETCFRERKRGEHGLTRDLAGTVLLRMSCSREHPALCHGVMQVFDLDAEIIAADIARGDEH